MFLTPIPGFEEDIEVFVISNTSISSSNPGLGVKITQRSVMENSID